MKKKICIIGLLGLISICGLHAKQKTYNTIHQLGKYKYDISQNDNLVQTDDSTYFKPKYFNMLREYIIKNGEIEKIDASSRIDKQMYVEYHVLSFDIWELKADNTNRIYFTMPQPEYKQYGNILLDNENIVKIECKDSSDAKIIFEVYNQILSKIDKEQNKPLD